MREIILTSLIKFSPEPLKSNDKNVTMNNEFDMKPKTIIFLSVSL